MYKGQFKGNVMHGIGVQFFKDGEKKMGQWENGELKYWIKEMEEGDDID